jgi:hypothetical protein
VHPPGVVQFSFGCTRISGVGLEDEDLSLSFSILSNRFLNQCLLLSSTLFWSFLAPFLHLLGTSLVEAFLNTITSLEVVLTDLGPVS